MEQFQSVFTKGDDTTKPPVKCNDELPDIEYLHITSVGVQKLFSNLKTARSMGPGGIPNIVLKTCAHEIAPALLDIVQQSIGKGRLTEDWRNAFVSPVYKKETDINLRITGQFP